MDKSCVFIPTNPRTGKESELFKELSSFFSGTDNARNNTVLVWQLLQTPAFRNQLSGLEYNKDGEPTIKSVVKALNLNSVVNDSTFKQDKIAIGAIDTKGNATIFKKADEVMNIVMNYNNTHTESVATVLENTDGYSIDINPANAYNTSLANNIAYRKALAGAMMELMRTKLGFDAEVMNSTSFDSRFNPMNAERNAEGLLTVMQIAAGERGLMDMPEEWSHMMVAGFRHTPLVQRLFAFMTEDRVRQVLGDAYDAYASKYNNDFMRLTEEAVGKVVQSYIVGDPIIFEDTRNLLQRIKDTFFRIISLITRQDYTNMIDKANADFNNFALSTFEPGAIDEIDKYCIFSTKDMYSLFGKNNIEAINSDGKLQQLAEQAGTLSERLVRMTKARSRASYKAGELDSIREIKRLLREAGGSLQEKKTDDDATKQEKKIKRKEAYTHSINIFLTEATDNLLLLASDLGTMEREYADDSNKNIKYLAGLASKLNAIKDFINMYEGYLDSLVKLTDTDLEEFEIEKQTWDLVLRKKAMDLLAVINGSTSTEPSDNLTEAARIGLKKVYTNLRFKFVYEFFSKFWNGKEYYVDKNGFLVENQEDADTVIRDGKLVTLGNRNLFKKGMVWSLEQLLEQTSSDIGVVERLVDSMADQSDPMLSLIDKIYKSFAEKRDAELRQITGEIAQAQSLYERQNPMNGSTSFMYDTREMYDFERDKDGNVIIGSDGHLVRKSLGTATTGDFISDIDTEEYRLRKEEYRLLLIQHEKDSIASSSNPNRKVNMMRINQMLNDWVVNNTEIYTSPYTGRVELRPKKSKYSYEALGKENPLDKLTDSQRAYYDKMLELKERLDFVMPESYNVSLRAPQVPKEIRHVKSVKEFFSTLWLRFKEHNFKESREDTDYGDGKTDDEGFRRIGVVDAEGKPINRVPLRFISTKDRTKISTNCSEALTAYAAMALNYKHMNDIVDLMELSKDVLDERKLVNAKDSSGKRIEQSMRDSRTSKRLREYLDLTLYGKSREENELRYKDIRFDKVMDQYKKYVSLLNLGLNPFSGISNVVMGRVALRTQAVGKKYFGSGDYAKGRMYYWKDMFQGEHLIQKLEGKAKMSNRMELLCQLYDITDDFYSNIGDTLYGNGQLMRMFGKDLSDIGFFMQHGGEHYLHAVTMYAILNHEKVKVNGEETSLLNAYHVVKYYEDGSKQEVKAFDKDPDAVRYAIELKDGVTKLDGSTFTQDDFEEVKRKIKHVNNQAHGAYSNVDKGAINRHWYGRLLMQFRQWMIKYYSARYGRAKWSSEVDDFTQGFYLTLFKFTGSMLSSMYKLDFDVKSKWHALNAEEQANCRKAMFELAVKAFLASILNTGLLAFLFGDKDDDSLLDKFLDSVFGESTDNKDVVFTKRMIKYQAKRAYMEVNAGSVVSWKILPIDFISNISKTVIMNPAAGVDRFNTLLIALDVEAYKKFYQTGKNKDKSRGQIALEQSVPFWKQLERTSRLADDEDKSLFQIFSSY